MTLGASKSTARWADHEGGCIKVFKLSDGTLLKTIGSKGSEPGQFNEPEGIAIDKDGNIIVADAGNNRVQVIGWE